MIDYINKTIADIAGIKLFDINIGDWNVSEAMKRAHLSKAVASQKMRSDQNAKKAALRIEKANIETSKLMECVNRRSPSEGNRQNVPMA